MDLVVRYLRPDVLPLLQPHLAVLAQALKLQVNLPPAPPPPPPPLTLEERLRATELEKERLREARRAAKTSVDQQRRWRIIAPEGREVPVNLQEAAAFFKIRPHSVRCGTSGGRIYRREIAGETYCCTFEPGQPFPEGEDPAYQQLLDRRLRRF